MRTPLLVGGLVILLAAGSAAGYFTGDRLLAGPTGTGVAGPLGTVRPPAPSPSPPVPVKTPLPNDTPALRVDELSFRTRGITLTQGLGPVRISVRVPGDWQKVGDNESQGEVKWLDPTRERGVRIEAGFPADLTTSEQRDKLLRELQDSQPAENDLRILSQTDSEVEDRNGSPRAVSTLVYTYIPKNHKRYVIVRWVATGDDQRATVEMSVTGLPDDSKAMNVLVTEASRSVTAQD